MLHRDIKPKWTAQRQLPAAQDGDLDQRPKKRREVRAEGLGRPQ
jgi:hypothetical protein